jgi:hypothetical protein
MKHTAHSRCSLSLIPSASRSLVLPALVGFAGLVGLAGCGSDAMSVGSNEASVEQSACQAEISGDIVAFSQADVDVLRGCPGLPGALRIMTRASAPDSISLAPLASLRRVGGPLDIRGPISSLAGLESLEAVGVLQLSDTLLTDLAPLRALTRVDTQVGPQPDLGADGIVISGCDGLADLSGLENLTTWGSLLIIQSAGLVSLDGLQAPGRAASVRLIDTPQLADVSG